MYATTQSTHTTIDVFIDSSICTPHEYLSTSCDRSFPAPTRASRQHHNGTDKRQRGNDQGHFCSTLMLTAFRHTLRYIVAASPSYREHAARQAARSHLPGMEVTTQHSVHLPKIPSARISNDVSRSFGLELQRHAPSPLPSSTNIPPLRTLHVADSIHHHGRQKFRCRRQEI